MSENVNVIPSEPQPRRKFKKGDLIQRIDQIPDTKTRIVREDEDGGRVAYEIRDGARLIDDSMRVSINLIGLVKTVDEVQPDLVNHPPHYTSSVNGIECIDAIQAALTAEEFRGFCKGNAIKYTFREQHKGGAEDLKKAQWYLARLTKEA